MRQILLFTENWRSFPFRLPRGAQRQIYALSVAESFEFVFDWPDVDQPEDLLRPKVEKVFWQPGLYLTVLDRHAQGSYPMAVRAAWSPDVRFPLQRAITTGSLLPVQLQIGSELVTRTLRIPEVASVGRVSLIEPVALGGQTVWAVGEAAYTQFGAAHTMEADVDGKLDEWAESAWVPFGEPEQARWTSGPRDFRQTSEDAYLYWSFAKGAHGLYLAFKGSANTQGDRFQVYFDAREPDALARPGLVLGLNVFLASMAPSRCKMVIRRI